MYRKKYGYFIFHNCIITVYKFEPNFQSWLCLEVPIVSVSFQYVYKCFRFEVYMYGYLHAKTHYPVDETYWDIWYYLKWNPIEKIYSILNVKSVS